ncbi:putative cyclic nucleotide-gated ion channel 16 [Hibiscus syriacus]|uniref:Cyclic nucleotide-gated ion channel 16 n=1 Tax=Hibiscus syriacus TaxID=106335 RepID=A0A6A3C5E7_HIBSY|nr:putative cyclic nucleotide-gated ion channel 16 [Hibiscus syriacus]
MNNVLQKSASKRFGNFPNNFSPRQEISWRQQILDPGSPIVTKWNHIILFTCLVALFLDPLYFYLPVIGAPGCIQIDLDLVIFVTFFRTVVGLFFFMHNTLKFRTAFVASNSKVFGKGELVMDQKAIAIRYIKTTFAIDLVATLPLPQILGASWYVLSIQRQYECWSLECKKEMNAKHSPSCNLYFLDCSTIGKAPRNAWLKQTNVIISCDALNDDGKDFKFGMYADAFTNNVASSTFIDKFFYCLWWGLKSSYGQSIETSTLASETLFCCFICIAGLVFFSHLIGNMQQGQKSGEFDEGTPKSGCHTGNYRRICKTVSVGSLTINGLPREVPFFAQMDDQLLDAICERLISFLNTINMFLIREGDMVNEMFFIIRDKVESSTTNGGRTGFYNSITLGPGDFCGEELLTWALDLRYVAKQFKRMHSKQLQHAFRYYSHQWRTWGACFIQAAWRRYKRKKLAIELVKQENLFYDMDDSGDGLLAVEEDEGARPDHRIPASMLSNMILVSPYWLLNLLKTQGNDQRR